MVWSNRVPETVILSITSHSEVLFIIFSTISHKMSSVPLVWHFVTLCAENDLSQREKAFLAQMVKILTGIQPTLNIQLYCMRTVTSYHE